MKKKYTNDKLLKLYKEKDGDIIDYSQIDFNNCDEKGRIKFICPKHGEYWQRPYAHITKGCKKCAMEALFERQRLRTIELGKNFIKLAKEQFKDLFSYDKTLETYKGGKHKCTVHCNKHNIDFEVYPISHLRKNGCCPMCESERKRERLKKGIEAHIDDFNRIYNFKYDYTKFRELGYYKNQSDIITVICPLHGEFKISIKSHKRGLECPICTKERVKNERMLTFEEFVKRANDVHKHKYIYNEYNGQFQKMNIWCPNTYANGEVHGYFSQTAHNHLAGNGCPKCKKSKLEEEVLIALQTKKITCEHFKTFQWLGRQSIDVFLPNYNIAIECQGIQHFKPIQFGGIDIGKAEHLFNINIGRDIKKKKLCFENNIKLVYFLDEKNAKYLNEDDIYFTNVEELINYILEQPKFNTEDEASDSKAD